MLSKRTMDWPSKHAWVAGSALLLACSGTAVIDAPDPTGSGGATTTATSMTTTATITTSSTVTSTATTTDACAIGEKRVLEWVDSAQACDPLINALQCTGETVIYDLCGCEIVANDMSPDEAAAALDAYQQWVDMGCGPLDCTSCPPPPDSPWYCDPTLARCLPAYE